MITDMRLLSELNELQDTRIIEWLKARQLSATIGMANAPDDRTSNIMAGRYRELADIIKEIETAKEEFLRQKAAKPRRSF